ncbi:hypothetical protein LAV79_19095 [Peribacillus butanolivorans]|uniref:hypothetical protein n=1 Tax=Peribacillus butanolivorans TaxID=421767 RepID=UPI0030C8FC66
MGEDTEQLTRVDVQKIDAEGKNEEALMITDNESWLSARHLNKSNGTIEWLKWLENLI